MCKNREKEMNKLKEIILNDTTNDSSGDSSNPSNDATNTNTNANIFPSHIYGVGTVAVMSIAVSLFVAYSKTFSQTSNKEYFKATVGYMFQTIKLLE